MSTSRKPASAMTVLAVHPDAASLELHMEIGGPQFRKLAAFIDLRLIEVYGEPNGKALNQLRQKADMLGEHGRVVVHQPLAGFARFPPWSPELATHANNG